MSLETGYVINRRLFAPAAIQANDNRVIGVDLGSVVRRLLLFDTYILHSVRLQDVCFLTQSLGSQGVMELIDAGALRFYSETYSIGEVGRARADLRLSGNNK